MLVVIFRGIGILVLRRFHSKISLRCGVSSGRNNPLSTGRKLEAFDQKEGVGDWPFRELEGCLMWLAIQTRLDIANAVRAVARYANKPREVHWGTATVFLEYSSTSDSALRSRRALGLSC